MPEVPSDTNSESAGKWQVDREVKPGREVKK